MSSGPYAFKLLPKAIASIDLKCDWLERLADYKSESPVMSKRISQFVALLIAFTLIFVALSAKYSSDAAAPQRPGTAAGGATRNAAIIAATAAVLKETSEIRELPILRPVRSGAQSRGEIERMLVKNLDEQMTAAEMHATELSLRKFGLVSSDFQYRPFIIKLLTEQVAGYYDARAREFHLADWLDLEGQKPVMAHELTHALQDQHFNLRRFEKWPHGDSDAELAVHALIEGDATLAMTIYKAKNPLVALAFTRSLTSSGISSEQFNQAPRALRESLIFPYLQGLEWTSQLYQRGGWDMVSKAFARLPLSSEQILHPEKYFNYEHPIKVVLPDFTNLLNSKASGRRSTTRRPLPTLDWHRIDSDVNGEWNYSLILDQFLNSPAESRRAAAGWAGDRYALYEGSGHLIFLGQIAAWDTENDAREFFDAYVKRTERRYPDAKPVELTLADSDDRRAWQTSEGGVVIELRGLRVLIIEGAPEGVDSKELVKAFG